jgi:hypothetical protein
MSYHALSKVGRRFVVGDISSPITGSFYVSTPSGDPYYNSVVLLLHFDGTDGQTTGFTDNSANNFPITNSGGKLSSTQAKFGTTSWYYNSGGTNTCVITPTSSKFNITAGQSFTIEGYYYLSSNSNGFLFGTNWAYSNTSGNAGVYYFPSDAKLRVIYDYPAVYTLTSTAPITGQWVHYALCRSSSNQICFYQNGVNVASGVDANALNVNTPWSIGGASAQLPWVGYIDEFRVTIGVCRYTGSFVTSSTAWPNSA